MDKRCAMVWTYWRLTAAVACVAMGTEAFAQTTPKLMIDMPDKVRECDIVQATVEGEQVGAAKEVEWEYEGALNLVRWTPEMGSKTAVSRALQFWCWNGAFTNVYSATIRASIIGADGQRLARANRQILICPAYITSSAPSGWRREGGVRSFTVTRKLFKETTTSKKGDRSCGGIVTVGMNDTTLGRTELKKSVESYGKSLGVRGAGWVVREYNSESGFSGYRGQNAEPLLFPDSGPSYSHLTMIRAQKGGVVIMIEGSASAFGARDYIGSFVSGYKLVYDDSEWLKANGARIQNEVDTIIDSLALQYCTEGSIPSLDSPKDVGEPKVVQVQPPSNPGDAERLWTEAKKAYEGGDLDTAEAKGGESVALSAVSNRVAFVQNLRKANQLWKEGQTLERQNKLKEALAKYKESIKLAASKERLKLVDELERRLSHDGSHPNLAGKWESYQERRKVADCEILQQGSALTFIVRGGTPQEQRSSGQFAGADKVMATDWRSTEGLVSKDAARIDWDDSYWIRVAPTTPPVIDLNGPWVAYQLNKKVGDCRIQQDGRGLTFTIREQVTYHGRLLDGDTTTVVLKDGTQELSGTICDGGNRIAWVDSEWVRNGARPTGIGPGTQTGGPDGGSNTGTTDGQNGANDKQPTQEQLQYVGGFAGRWSSNWGVMTLQVSGVTVTGEYTHDKGRIEATLGADGKTMAGTWSEAPDYRPPGNAGKVTLELSSDGNSLQGRWGYGDSLSGNWTGTRIKDTLQ